MVVPRKLAPVLLTLVALVLAGCSNGGGAGTDDGEAPPIDATATTGGIRGVVVDDRIVPIKAASIVIQPANKTLETDAEGLFSISGLEAGDYVVTATHPLFDTITQTTTVVAGDANPKMLKLQLTRVIFADPYATTEKFEGYIVCSAGHAFVGYSEECGEGVGSPEQTCSIPNAFGIPGVPCVDNPIMPGERIGGQGNNNVQYDFYVETADVKTIQVEMKWEPTAQTAASGQLLTYVSTEWLCDPFCHGKTFVRGGSGSPMLLRADVHPDGTLNNTVQPGECGGCDDVTNITTDMVFTVFTWANPDTVDPVTGEVPLASAIVNQAYNVYITKSYVLPLPEGWSFINEDPQPFT